MSTTTVNISFPSDLLAAIDAEARRESRSRSELLREAARLYVRRQQRWERLFEMGDRLAEQRGLEVRDVETEIHRARRERRARG